MLSRRTRPSITSLVAFVLIASPVVYVLSYAPVVRHCAYTVKLPVEYPEPGIVVRTHQRMADASAYGMYQPVDWMIDNTPLREPLFFWAGIWGVRIDFEFGYEYRCAAADENSGLTPPSP